MPVTALTIIHTLAKTRQSRMSNRLRVRCGQTPAAASAGRRAGGGIGRQTVADCPEGSSEAELPGVLYSLAEKAAQAKAQAPLH